MDIASRNKAYNDYVNSKAPLTKMWPTLIWAFLIGGLICVIGEGLGEMFKWLFPKLAKEDIAASVSGTLVFLAALLTGLGLFDRIGKVAGAGTIIPITGFSNSISAAALEFKNEGFIFGMCAKMFVIAGPVIVNGVSGGVIVGLIYFIIGLF